MPTFHLLPTSLPSQFASFKLFISLVSLLLLWTGPVRTYSSSFMRHDIDIIQPAIASSVTFIWFISILFSYEKASSVVRPF
jgi:hypothetical protein